MKAFLKNVMYYLTKTEEQISNEKELICAFRLSYNNFDEKLGEDHADYYSECKH